MRIRAVPMLVLAATALVTTPALAQLRLGAYLSPYLAIEGRAGNGGSARVNNHYVEVRDIEGGYLKGLVPVSRGLSLYGIAGVTAAQLHRDCGTRKPHGCPVAPTWTMALPTPTNPTWLQWAWLGTSSNPPAGTTVVISRQACARRMGTPIPGGSLNLY